LALSQLHGGLPRNGDTWSAAFLHISLAFVIMSLFSSILYFFIYAQHHYLMSMYTFDIKRDVFHKLLKCDPEVLTDLSSGDIMNNIQLYTTECMHFVIRNIIHMVNNIICSGIIILYIFIISWQIGLFTIAAVPATVIINAKFGKKIRGYSDIQRSNYGDYISWVYEMFSGIRDIRILGAEHKADQLFTEKHKRMFEANMKSSVSGITAQNIIDFTSLFIQIAIFAFRLSSFKGKYYDWSTDNNPIILW
jgi:ABC-type multidrug transport system fused ATPase/permease subunit